MLYSGVSWSATGYEVEVVDRDGQPVGSAAGFEAGQIDEMINYLRTVPAPAATVVDSTCGILDGRMMAAGLAVYRADPALLPARPLLGSVHAVDLARAAARNLAAVVRLEPARGTQTGREADLLRGIAGSTSSLDALIDSGRCLSHGSRDRREVALTFDDGPQPPYTDQVLDVLNRYGIPATFFCVGLHAGAFPGHIARMLDDGHVVANHTWSHPFLPELTRPQLFEQIDRTYEAISVAGGGTSPLFRPPYGSRTPEVVDWLSESGSTIVLWDVEPDDWAMPGAATIARTVLDQTRPGSVILLHDGGGDRSQTVAALPPIIEGLLAQDYRFVVVDDLLAGARATAPSHVAP